MDIQQFFYEDCPATQAFFSLWLVFIAYAAYYKSCEDNSELVVRAGNQPTEPVAHEGNQNSINWRVFILATVSFAIIKPSVIFSIMACPSLYMFFSLYMLLLLVDLDSKLTEIICHGKLIIAINSQNRGQAVEEN